MDIVKKIRLFLLRIELRSAGRFWIGGYKDRMVYLNNRYLKDWQVDEVHRLKSEGKIVQAGTKSITSTSTGKTYVDPMFKMI